ncbi:Bestrophin, RFP-TM, chloride channel-domain-containing protein [Cytidiella melzeri]|nr:Bestrophin, RFP-TM, chloride channel-domain-containing protein [Cytidiella melzeri]
MQSPTSTVPPRRSATGHHLLRPASESHVNLSEITLVPTRTFLSFTLGRGTVMWRIWPAVFMHTAFAAVVVSMSLKTPFALAVPNVLLTLLGVVIGFVISYRAMSGYDRYWQGRSSWSDVMRTSRTFARLVWFHVPLSLLPPGAPDPHSQARGDKRTEAEKAREEKAREKEVHRLMAEKRMALDLIEAFCTSLKHHLRGEMGIYYEDLYPLVKPLHEHKHKETDETNHKHAHNGEYTEAGPSEQVRLKAPRNIARLVDPVVPSINSYGTLTSTPQQHAELLRTASRASESSAESINSAADESQPLLPNSVLQKRKRKGMMESFSADLLPFAGILNTVATFLRLKQAVKEENLAEDVEASALARTHYKHRPRVAGGGENVPLEVLRALTCWLSVLEERNSVYGNTLGGMFGCIAAFEDSLATMEKILTTPLPYVFAIHISTVWLYLFALPFQLVDQFGWHTIPGVCIASFIYLGFVATGEEIEQPFGYDDNDLDIDLFCHAIVHSDLEKMKETPWKNVWLGHPHPIPAANADQGGKHGRVEETFGQQR